MWLDIGNYLEWISGSSQSMWCRAIKDIAGNERDGSIYLHRNLLTATPAHIMHFKLFALLCGAAGSALAQRPSGVSICDYYTTALLKEDTPANQYALLTVLVNTVVIGNYSACAVGGGLPGILAPANYGGEQVNLLPYFNGCLLSTNVNNMPSSVNFLDGGGAAPLKNNMPANNPNSNQ